MNLFDKINHYIEGAEGSIITLVTTLIPWLAPALPAWLTWHHLTQMLDIPGFIAGMMALTVEFLGLSAVSTAFTYMRHNKINKAQKNHVSLAFPVGAYLFYLLVIVTVNIIQEIPMSEQGQQISRVASIALLTMISAPAFVIAVARDQQRKIGSEIESARQLPKVAESAKKISRGTFEEYLIANGKRNGNGPMKANEIMAMFNVPKRTAYNWIVKSKEIQLES